MCFRCRVSVHRPLSARAHNGGRSSCCSLAAVGTPAPAHVAASGPVCAHNDAYCKTHRYTESLFGQVLTLLITSRGDTSLCIVKTYGGEGPPKLSWLIGLTLQTNWTSWCCVIAVAKNAAIHNDPPVQFKLIDNYNISQLLCDANHLSNRCCCNAVAETTWQRWPEQYRPTPTHTHTLLSQT